MAKIKKIFITGGTGKIGRYIVNELANQGHELIVLSRFKRKITQNIRYLRGDITKLNFEIPKCDVIVHLAGVTGMFDKECMDVNYLGTKKLLEKIPKGIDIKFIFFSSIDAYGMTDAKSVSKKGSEHPAFIYGKSKLLAEKEITGYGRKNKKLKYTILRLGNVESIKDKEFSKNIDTFYKNIILRHLMSGYEYNIISIKVVVKKVSEIVKSDIVNRGLYYLTGESISISKKYKLKESRLAMFLGWIIFRLMSLLGKGGSFVYLTYGGIKYPYRRFVKHE